MICMHDTLMYLKKSWKYFKKSKKLFALLCILGLFFTGLSAIIPILSAKIITSITSNLITQLFFLAIVLFIVHIFSRLTDIIMDNCYFRYSGRIVLEIQKF